MTRILVTAALGTTGSLVAGLLRSRGHEVTAASRRATGFDWNQPETYAPALSGASAVYIVPPAGEPEPAKVMEPFLRAAFQADVRRAVLLSASPVVPGDSGAGRVQSLIPEYFPEWTVLRPTWFMQNVLTPTHPHAITLRTGTLVTSTDGARVALIDAADIAEVAVHALTGTPSNTDLLLTGPSALTYDEVVSTISEVAGLSLQHRDVPSEELVSHLTQWLPAAAAARMAGLDRIIAAGGQARVTSTVSDVTGRPPRTFRDWVTGHRDLFA